MRVVSNTSPIGYLILIEQIDVLPALYSEILIPDAVRLELLHPEGPEPIRTWMARRPLWLEVRDIPAGAEEEKDLADLDIGEREAIWLAAQEGADLVILDERDGRAAAGKRGLALTGTIGVLGAAAANGLVDAGHVVERLRRTSFRASPALYRWLLSKQR